MWPDGDLPRLWRNGAAILEGALGGSFSIPDVSADATRISRKIAGVKRVFNNVEIVQNGD